MRISRHDLRRRYSNSLVIDAGSQFNLKACSQARWYMIMILYAHLHGHKVLGTWLLTFYEQGKIHL